ncbi:hypothetical protein M8542_42395 [Amycolatopsis sp. OK19-0408]|uniref:Uncharacterized protein n=1 Tax=Amycolatopsis iheyensis TaxID=2945988 RepID=A0A9X2SQB9_9PSEU|nr:hypothetical protein [Amycolatopsis iheyensis]MCR6489488.1 hypothetical protein [Amycolatopsis iheyensis]
MTDLERKLAETLREQAGEVTPNLDAAWAEQLRRQRRPRRRRLTVVVAPLAAVLVVLTSVLLATQLNTDSAVQPASPGMPIVLSKPEYTPLSALRVTDTPAVVTTFVGQSDTWSTYAFTATVAGTASFCLAAVPRGDQLIPEAPQYGAKSPSCMPLGGGELLAGYVGENDGPLPAGKAVYVVDPRHQHGDLRLFDAAGDLSQPTSATNVSDYIAYLADVKPDSPPVRYDFTPVRVHPASR